MCKMKDIEKYLNKSGIKYYRSDNGQKIVLRACYFSEDNFFDYGERFKEPICNKKEKFLQELFEDPRIIIQTCDWCCGCAGW